MMYGDDLLIECPHCGGVERCPTFLSGNYIGVESWTDGYSYAPMFPRNSAVACCHHCSNAYWVESAVKHEEDEHAEHSPSPEISTPLEGAHISRPSEAQYYLALEAGLAANAAEERFLRILTWWRSNDDNRESIRYGHRRIDFAYPYHRIANMHSLMSLLDPSDLDDQIMRAEILRELGEFDEAIAVLSSIKSQNHDWAVEFVTALCHKKNSELAKFE